MQYLISAIERGYPRDCATNGTTYADLVRTWNAAYGSPPSIKELEASPARDTQQTNKPKRGFFAKLFGGNA